HDLAADFDDPDFEVVHAVIADGLVLDPEVVAGRRLVTAIRRPDPHPVREPEARGHVWPCRHSDPLEFHRITGLAITLLVVGDVVVEVVDGELTAAERRPEIRANASGRRAGDAGGESDE